MSTQIDFVCTQCHTRQVVGPSVGSPLLSLVALMAAALAFLFAPMMLALIVAGLCVGVMMVANKPSQHRCKACGSASLIPVSTPAGSKLVATPMVLQPLDQAEELRHFGVTQDGDKFVWGGQRFASPEAALMFAKSRA